MITSDAIRLCLLLANPSLPQDVAIAQCQYRVEQQDLNCANHPDKCFRPETENEKAQREYKERQLRIQN